jgi:hypothetical protein
LSGHWIRIDGQALKNYVGEVLLVGINYDKDSKKHTCLIDKAKKDDKV